MEVHSILDATAQTYARLRSFSVDISAIQEAGDEGASNRTEQRSRAYFSAPDKVRIEQLGRHGKIVVTDGVESHHYLSLPKRYWKRAVEDRQTLPGMFRPEFPVQGEVFLFSRISEFAARSEYLHQETIANADTETLCHVVQVRYETSENPHLFVSCSPVTFWIDTRTSLVLRLQGESSFRMPPDGDIRTSKVIVSFHRPRIDDPIPPQTFLFVAPAGVEELSGNAGGGMVGGMAGGGIVSHGSAGREAFDTWHNHEWDGDSLIERSRLRFQGLELVFERRMTLSQDSGMLRIVERITGPQGDVERELSIPAR